MSSNDRYQHKTAWENKSLEFKWVWQPLNSPSVSPTRPFKHKLPMSMIFLDSLNGAFEYNTKTKTFQYLYSAWIDQD